jgi:hypothetical protein
VPSFAVPSISREFVNLSTIDIARICLNRAGQPTIGLGADALITRAFQTTSDYPNMLANLLNKSLRMAYEVAESGIRRCALETSAPDFRAKSRIMLDWTAFTLVQINESAEFQYGTMADTAESYSLQTFGRLFNISRKALVNDDLGGFTRLPAYFGNSAAEFERKYLTQLITSNSGLGPTMSDTIAMFNAAHANLVAVGAGAAPGVNTLSTARNMMRQQTGPGGGLIGVVPRFLLVPSALETTGQQLMHDTRPVTFDQVNPFNESALELVVEPRLDAVSTKAWYLIADPARLPGLEFAYLAGSPGPQVDTQIGFEVDGMKFKIRLDFGAGVVDFRGWVLNWGQ